MPLTDWLEKNGFVKKSEEKEASVPASKPVAPRRAVSSLPPMPGRSIASSTPEIELPPLSVDTSKFDQYFSNLFKKANLPGPDYFEFWNMMNSLRKAIPDHAARATAAFTTLISLGTPEKPVTKSWLIESAKKYIEMIQKDRLATDKEIEAIDKQQIGGISNEIAQLESSISAAQQQIEALQRTIDESGQKAEQKRIELQQEKAKLQQNRTGYYAASDAALANIQTDIQLIETTL